MKRWYIVSDGKSYECEFISINTLRLYMWLKLSGKSFKVIFHSIQDYNYAKRGEEINVNANTRGQSKSCKVVFR